MKISQYVYLCIYSQTIDAEQITDALGVAPDAVKMRGSRTAQPPRPLEHSWQIECRDAGMAIDDQVEALLDRITPVVAKLRALVDESDVSVGLQMVRSFDDEGGEDELLPEIKTEDGRHLVKLSGQHQPLGWVLKPEQIQLLGSVGAWISADEYA
ncbi:DUF4279 domain-containing protein [Jatrophihabitans sp. YIM 134969]